MKTIFISLLAILLSPPASAQGMNYPDSLQSFRTTYVSEHEVVKGSDRTYFRFFPADLKFRMMARFEKIDDAPWFAMATSGKIQKVFRVYGLLYFSINGKAMSLRVYQSKDLLSNAGYSRYLFLPFTDKTSGNESYENGRYIDLTLDDVENGQFLLDFNKAYNPYCAYISNQYNCPIPPRENELDISIRAGEMKFGRDH